MCSGQLGQFFILPLELTFKALEVANHQRVGQFKNRLGQPAHSHPLGHDWSIAEWTNAMAGETGEACNLAKKIIRGDFHDNPEAGVQALMEELADVIIYADLAAQRVGCSLGDFVRAKFNSKSEQIGCPVKIL